jgi:hypothetical protein
VQSESQHYFRSQSVELQRTIDIDAAIIPIDQRGSRATMIALHIARLLMILFIAALQDKFQFYTRVL